jgi:YHS domain-containing protein
MMMLPCAPCLPAARCLLRRGMLGADEGTPSPKPYPLENCVVSNDKIDPQVAPVVFNGQEYRFCCRGCVKKFNRDPEKYAARLAASTSRAANASPPGPSGGGGVRRQVARSRTCADG